MASRSSRGTRRSGATKTRGKGSPARMHRGRGGRPTGGGPKVSLRRGTSRHGPSIKKPDTYEALRRKGYSKRKAAAISNAQANGTISHHRGRPK